MRCLLEAKRHHLLVVLAVFHATCGITSLFVLLLVVMYFCVLLPQLVLQMLDYLV